MEVEEEEDRRGGDRGGGERRGEDSEGKRLAEVVKATHRHLRERYKEAGGREGADAGVWREHLERGEHLHRYAQAMHALATQHWPSDNQTSISRVGWVRAAVRDYYWGGGLQAATNKEMRKLSHLGLAPDQPYKPCPPPPDGTVRVLDVGSCYNPFRVFPEFEVTAIDLCPAHESVFKGDFLNMEIMEKEDEGGGGGEGQRTKVEEEENEQNTERKKEEKEEGKIHKQGKTEEEEKGGREETDDKKPEQDKGSEGEERDRGGGVVRRGERGEEEESEGKEEERGREGEKGGRREERCKEEGSEGKEERCKGGRRKETSEREEERGREEEGGGGRRGEKQLEPPSTTTSTVTSTPNATSTTTITSLPASSFHVLVLSLVLEYFPAPTQRFECCARAWRLLAPGGLLAIITPDSRHQGANAHLYQLWRVSLAGLGFARIKYDKQAHFHGFVFRKGLCRAAWQSDVPRLLTSASKAAPSVRAKLRGIDYSKVHCELYIPQDFEEQEGSGRKRARKSCGETDPCKKKRKECGGEDTGRGETDEEKREEKRREEEGEKQQEESQGMEEGRRGEINGKREREEVKEIGGEEEDKKRREKMNGVGKREEEVKEKEEGDRR